MWVRHNEAIIAQNVNVALRKYLSREHAIASVAPATSSKSPLQCAGLNRHEAEDESSLRERSSDPLGLESCAATARDTAKRRQRIGGVGIQLRKDAIRTPTPL